MKLRRAQTIPTLIGHLLEDRLQANGWPLNYTGADYFGPLQMTDNKRRKGGSRYILI